jgi:hypothetical protein
MQGICPSACNTNAVSFSTRGGRGIALKEAAGDAVLLKALSKSHSSNAATNDQYMTGRHDYKTCLRWDGYEKLQFSCKKE